MPLLPDQLHARLTSIYSNTTNNNNSTELANAIYEYLVPITPPSTGVDLARPALVTLFNGLSGNPDSWYITALNAGLPTYAAAIAAGMAPQFTAVPPSRSTLPNFAGIFKSNTDDELSWGDCAQKIANAIHTWFSQGTATDTATGTTITWGQTVPEPPLLGSPGTGVTLEELPGIDSEPPKPTTKLKTDNWPTTYLGDPSRETTYTTEDNVFTSNYGDNPTRQWLQTLRSTKGKKGVTNGELGEPEWNLLTTVRTRGNVTINASDPRIVTHAVPYLYAWMDEMTSIGVSITITSCFRTFAHQQAIEKKYKRPQAAKAGTSNHGWGVAIDINELYIHEERTTKDAKGNKIIISRTKDFTLQQSIRQGNTYKLIAGIGKKYDWYNPYLLRDSSGADEPWHFEYWGPAPGVNLTA